MSLTKISKVTNEKTTIYLDPKVKKTVQFYALRDNRSLSEIINQRLYEYLEDMADIVVFNEAKESTTGFIDFENTIKELGFDIDEIRNKATSERKKATKKN